VCGEGREEKRVLRMFFILLYKIKKWDHGLGLGLDSIRFDSLTEFEIDLKKKDGGNRSRAKKRGMNTVNR
jgi:hypothetical protein